MSQLLVTKKQITDAGYAIACFLTFIAVVSSLSRYLLSHDLHMQIASILYGEPYTEVQFAELSKRPIQEFIHRVVGAAYMIIGLLQFTPSFRKKNWKLHRVLGRVFVIFSLLVGLGGIYMGLSYPFAGWRETVPTLLFGGLFIYFVFMGYRRARQRKILEHQLWMIRSFSIALGIATIRIIVLAVNTLTDIEYNKIFIFAFWCAWTMHLVLTEAGIYLAFTRKVKKVQYAG
ncbi:MAG: DUF2306 domain-containing protein [Cyclobacteriaceae bacterium]